MRSSQPRKLLLSLFADLVTALPLQSAIPDNVLLANKEPAKPLVRSSSSDQTQPKLSYAEIGGITAGTVAGIIIVASIFYLLLARGRHGVTPQPTQVNEHKDSVSSILLPRKHGRQQRQQRRQQYKKSGTRQEARTIPAAEKTQVRPVVEKIHQNHQQGAINSEPRKRRKSRIPISPASRARQQPRGNRSTGRSGPQGYHRPNRAAHERPRREGSERGGGGKATNQMSRDDPPTGALEIPSLHITSKPARAATTTTGKMPQDLGRLRVMAEGRPHPIASYQQHTREQWVQAGAQGRATGGFPRGEDGALWI